jgi:hypothetical protein
LVYPNGVPPAAREHHQNNMPGWLSYHQSGGGGFSPRNGAGGDAQAYGSDTWGESAMPIMSAAGTPGNFGAASGTMNATVLKPVEPFSEDRICTWLLHLATALSFLHSHGVIHRDIKLQNILVTSGAQLVKIADFGIADNLIVNGKEGFAKTTVGTPLYMAPEVCEGLPYNTQSDIWSLGIVAYELCNRRPPFNGANMLAVAAAISNQGIGRIEVSYSDALDVIVRGMLSKDPKQRPTAELVLRMLKLKRQGASAADIALAGNVDITKLGARGEHQASESPSAQTLAPLVTQQSADAEQQNEMRSPCVPMVQSGRAQGISAYDRQNAYEQARAEATDNRRKFLLDQESMSESNIMPQPHHEPPASGRNGGVEKAEFSPQRGQQLQPERVGRINLGAVTGAGANRDSVDSAISAEYFREGIAAEQARQRAKMDALFPETPRIDADAKQQQQQPSHFPAADEPPAAQGTPAGQEYRTYHAFDVPSATASPQGVGAVAVAAGRNDENDIDSTPNASAILPKSRTPSHHHRGKRTPSPPPSAAVTVSDLPAPLHVGGGTAAPLRRSSSSRPRPDSATSVASAPPTDESPRRKHSKVKGSTDTSPNLIGATTSTAVPSAATSISSQSSRRMNMIQCRNCAQGQQRVMAAVYCDTCSQPLCTACAMVIHKHSMFQEHSIWAFDNGGQSTVKGMSATSISVGFAASHTQDAVFITSADDEVASPKLIMVTSTSTREDAAVQVAFASASPAIASSVPSTQRHDASVDTASLSRSRQYAPEVPPLPEKAERSKAVDTGCCVVM